MLMVISKVKTPMLTIIMGIIFINTDLSCIFLSYPNYFTYITVVILTESQFYIF